MGVSVFGTSKNLILMLLINLKRGGQERVCFGFVGEGILYVGAD